MNPMAEFSLAMLDELIKEPQTMRKCCCFVRVLGRPRMSGTIVCGIEVRNIEQRILITERH